MKKPKALALLCVLLCLTMVSADALQLLAGCRTQSYQPSKQAAPIENGNVNSEYVVSVFNHGKWQEAGRLGYDMFLEEKSMDLSEWLADNSAAAVRIIQEGGEAAHLDSVFLGGEAPQSVNFDDGILLIKLSKKDLDLINVDTDGIELIFPANRSNDVLTVTGRIEGKLVSRESFKFPSENNYKEINKYSKFYSYRLDSVSKTLTVDGNLEETEGLKPLFKEYCRPGTGHPEGFTYGWIMNDEDYLYAVVDFTPDNTMDGDKDYSKLYIRTNDIIREFKVSVPETTWGQPAFTYTDKVGYQHKVYEFKIPMEEITEAGRSDIELAFSAYGTAGIWAIHPSVAYSSFNDKYLLVYESYYGSILYGQFVNSDASYDGDPFVIEEPAEDTWSLNFSPEVVYDEDHSQFLVVWKSCNSSGAGYIKGRLIEYRNGSAPVLGTAFNVSELQSGFSYTHDSPSAAYNDAANKFLVAWADYNGTTNPIYARLIESDGELAGESNLTICDSNNSIVSVSVASGSGSNFIAVYMDDTDTKCIVYRQMISGAGDQGPSIQVYDTENLLSSPHICFNDSSGLYLATWIESNDTIGGRYLSDYGSISPIYLELASDSDTYYMNSSTIYNNQSNTYLSVWDGLNFGEDPAAFGQLFDEDLGEQGGIISFGDEEMYPPEFIDSAANTNAGNYLVAYSSYYSSDKVYVELVGDVAEYEPMASINPALAYNPDENNYLLVYTNQELYEPTFYKSEVYKSEVMENPRGETSYTDNIGIVGQFISSTAEAQGKPFLISEKLGEDYYHDMIDYPDVAYGDNMYLVVWAEEAEDPDRSYSRVTNIMGSLLHEDGKPYTDASFTIAEDIGYIYDSNLTVAYGEKGSFLVAWSSDDGDIMGREVIYDSAAADYDVTSNNISICTAKKRQLNPSIAYSTELQKFLVVWEDERDYTDDKNCPFSNIYGAYLKKNETGELIVDEEIPVYTGKHYQMDPSAAYNSNSGQFAITWHNDEDNKNSICGVLVNSDGSISQEETKLIAGEPDDSIEQYYEYLSTVYNPTQPDEYFSVWSTYDYDKYCVWGMGQQASDSLVPSGSGYDFGENIYNNNDRKLDIACNTTEGNYLVAYPCGGSYYEEFSSRNFSSEYSDIERNAYITWELIGEVHENTGIIRFKDTEDGDVIEDCIYYDVDEDHGILEIPVERFGGFSGDVTVTYAAYGNADNPEDYEILGDYPVFSGSESEDIIKIQIKDDDIIDPGEYIQLEISDTGDAELGDIIKAEIHINDNDSASVRFSSSSYTVAENVYAKTGTDYSEIKVIFSGFQPIEEYSLFSSYEGQDGDTVFSVVYETSDGTASEGEDYTEASGLLHFGWEAGERTFRVPIIDDNKDEVNETVNLRLSFAGQETYRSGAVEGDTIWIGDYPVTLGTPKTATLTITDDDTAPSKPKDKKDRKKTPVVEPPKETPPPVEGLPDDALVDRMPGYIVLSTPVKINTVKEEISLSCNKDILAESPDHDARIYYWNPDVSKWVALATYPDGSGKVKAINDGGHKGWFVVFGVIQPHFADINSHWAEQLINRMNGLGLIEGYALKDSDMRVARPEQKVTRAEFTMFVTRIMNMNPDNILLPDIPDSETESILAKNYTDASEISPWVRAAVAKATKAGLVPFEGSSFKPLEPITRIEAAVMVSRALKKFKDFKTADLGSFKDSSDIPGWAAGQVVENVLKGYPDNTLKPNNNMPRAESLAMLLRLFINGLGW